MIKELINILIFYYETPLTEPSGHNFFRIKVQKDELTSEGSNVAVPSKEFLINNKIKRYETF